MNRFWIEAGALLLLTAILSVRLAKRARQHWAKRSRLGPGHGFDSGLVQQRLEQLRRNYGVSAAERRRNPRSEHDCFVASTRARVRRRAFFRSACRELAPTATADEPVA